MPSYDANLSKYKEILLMRQKVTYILAQSDVARLHTILDTTLRSKTAGVCPA